MPKAHGTSRHAGHFHPDPGRQKFHERICGDHLLPGEATSGDEGPPWFVKVVGPVGHAFFFAQGFTTSRFGICWFRRRNPDTNWRCHMRAAWAGTSTSDFLYCWRDRLGPLWYSNEPFSLACLWRYASHWSANSTGSMKLPYLSQ